MTDLPPSTNSCSWRRRWLWPVIAAIASLPPLAASAAMLMLWQVHLWNAPPWVVILGAVSITLAGCAAVLLAARAILSRRFRYSMRTMLLATTIAAVVCATLGRIGVQQTRSAMAMRELLDSGGAPEVYPTKEDDWLEQRLGFDMFNKVDGIELPSAQAVDTLLENADSFDHLEWVSFPRPATDEVVSRAKEFEQFPEFKSFALYHNALTDESLKHISQCDAVEDLFVNGSEITDTGLSYLTRLPKLQSIRLVGDEDASRMAITDAGMNSLGRVTGLRRLWFKGLPITDAGALSLATLQDLQWLLLRNTDITEQGYEQLCHALPNCLITGDHASFPHPVQVRRVVVSTNCADEATSISRPDKLEALLAFLENWIAKNDVGWKDVSPDSKRSVLARIEGADRTLRRFGIEGSSFFIQFERRSRGIAISAEDEVELRRLLRMP